MTHFLCYFMRLFACFSLFLWRRIDFFTLVFHANKDFFFRYSQREVFNNFLLLILLRNRKQLIQSRICDNTFILYSLGYFLLYQLEKFSLKLISPFDCLINLQKHLNYNAQNRYDLLSQLFVFHAHLSRFKYF